MIHLSPETVQSLIEAASAERPRDDHLDCLQRAYLVVKTVHLRSFSCVVYVVVSLERYHLPAFHWELIETSSDPALGWVGLRSYFEQTLAALLV